MDICDVLLQAHCTTLRELDLSETEVKDKGITCLIETMRKCTTICKVGIEGCKEISMEVKEKLNAALRKNTI